MDKNSLINECSWNRNSWMSVMRRRGHINLSLHTDFPRAHTKDIRFIQKKSMNFVLFVRFRVQAIRFGFYKQLTVASNKLVVICRYKVHLKWMMSYTAENAKATQNLNHLGECIVPVAYTQPHMNKYIYTVNKKPQRYRVSLSIPQPQRNTTKTRLYRCVVL